MTDVSIELLDAKLQAAEARTEAGVARLEVLVENSISNNKQAISDFQEEHKYTRRTIIITAVTSVVAIVLGIAAFNAALFSNIVGAFDLGQRSRTAISEEINNQLHPTAAKLERTDIKLDRVANALEQINGIPYPDKDPRE